MFLVILINESVYCLINGEFLFICSGIVGVIPRKGRPQPIKSLQRCRPEFCRSPPLRFRRHQDRPRMICRRPSASYTQHSPPAGIRTLYGFPRIRFSAASFVRRRREESVFTCIFRVLPPFVAVTSENPADPGEMDTEYPARRREAAARLSPARPRA